MEDDHRKEGTVNLLEDCWFFGNLLYNRKAKILRCNSDPAPSSNQEQEQEEQEEQEEEMFVIKKSTSKANNLLRTPSLPPQFGGHDEDWDEDEEDGARMGDLIRQAMPCMIKKEVCKGPTMSKLSRRSSLDPSLLLPPKHNTKGISSSAPNTSKNLQQSRNVKPRNLERSMSLKTTLSDVEVQGFQDLGFKFDKDDLSPSVASKLAKLQIKEEVDEQGEQEMGFKGKRNPTLSEAWDATQWSRSPSIPKWIDTKRSSEDMKAQIKFWARSVASNVHQEC